MSVPPWLTKLRSLSNLSEEEKGQAKSILLTKPAEERPLYVDGTDGEVAAAIKQLLAKEAVVTAPPGISPGAALTSSLPLATTSSTFIAVPSARTAHEFKPDTVCAWTHVDPADPSSSPLEAAIMAFQDAANSTFLGRDGTLTRLPTPIDKFTSPLDSEAEVASMWHTAVSEPLNRLAQVLPFASAPNAHWKQLPPKDIISDALTYTQQHAPATASQSGLPSITSRRDRPVQPVVHHDAGTITASTSSKRKMDLVLTIEDDQHEPVQGLADLGGELHAGGHGAAAANSAPPTYAPRATKRRRCICVGEVKTAERLMSGVQQPVDLVVAWGSEQDPYWHQAQAVVAQLFTYMQLWKICYGFITCWFGTWLAYCPPHERHSLYLSAPILSTTRHQPTAPAVTAMGAVAWLQHRALQFGDDEVASHPGPASGNAGHQSDEDTDERDAGARTGSAEEYQESRGRETGSSASKSANAKTPNSPPSYSPSGSAVLQLHYKLCSGSTGSVVRGAYGSDEAVVKLLGPDSHGLLDYDRELQAYTTLAGLQGKVVPRLLGAGHLAAGVYFLATQLVVGVPLSSLLPNIPPAVASAAVSALKSVHKAHTGFIHGDIRLQNIMLADNTAGNDTTATCMVIDFGRSRIDGTPSSQAKELKKLKRLLGMP